MKTLEVITLNPGDAFSKPVYIDPSNILVEENVPVSQSDIDRLKKWNIKKVQTSGTLVASVNEKEEYESQAEENDIKEIRKKLRDSILRKSEIKFLMIEGEKLIKDCYLNISENKPFQISTIRTYAEKICVVLDEAPYAFLYAYSSFNLASIEGHSVSSAIYGALIAKATGYSKPKQIELVFSILLMDIGMVRVPVMIRQKAEKLTDQEASQVQAHTVLGYQLLTRVAKVKNSIALVALQHHENFDGSGYPRKIKGSEMSQNAKIATVADAFAALLEIKTYRDSKLPYVAMKELLTLGIYRYDPNLLKALLNTLSIYPVSSIVKMSDDSIAMVAGSSVGKPMRPLVLMLREADGTTPEEPKFTHLLYKTDKFIATALNPKEEGIQLEAELDKLIKII